MRFIFLPNKIWQMATSTAHLRLLENPAAKTMFPLFREIDHSAADAHGFDCITIRWTAVSSEEDARASWPDEHDYYRVVKGQLDEEVSNGFDAYEGRRMVTTIPYLDET